ncbi:Methyltransferase-like protein 27 [Pseudocercospora fuligena]|uniref:Methyltransferase-like protein 27 n=1 Tax=Pseudocercospora fuligena TaxID=685502 RepID=A0A8H6RR90_9PEZI|nr:Methyltransferase-like protein 27 [Pseudocercospora fuligena]
MSSPKVTTSSGGNDHVTSAYNAKDHKELTSVYDAWASEYDEDLLKQQDYVAPAHVAQAVVDAGGDMEGLILDAGCGTGLSGAALVKAGAKAGSIDGLDLSPGMLDVARKSGIYRDLEVADLNKPISKPDSIYDIVICVGTFTHKHVGPKPALEELVRVLKTGGILAATILDDIWTKEGFADEVDRLEKEALAEVIGSQSMDYRKAAGVKAKVLALRKN